MEYGFDGLKIPYCMVLPPARVITTGDHATDPGFLAVIADLFPAMEGEEYIRSAADNAFLCSCTGGGGKGEIWGDDGV
ncbi:hypothetical protein FQN52_008200 [Onygenales sp. PD_12]|nr:hypothetical protein FQN52_008200 [Onygenales sp. PD_12]